MATPLKVLIVEDQVADAELMERELRRAGFAPVCRRAETEEGYRSQLDPGLDVILADYTLPSFDATRALEILAETGLDVPLILVTGTVGEVKAVNCMKLGAADYLLKDRLGRLGPAVTQALEARALRRKESQAKENLRASEERFRLLFDQAPLGYQSLDAQGRFVEVNRTWLEMMGYTRKEVIGRGFADFLDSRGAAQFEQSFQEFKCAGEVCGVEFEMRRKDGSSFTAAFTGKIAHDESGGFIQTHCVLQDVTRQRQAEQALRQSEENYRRIVETSQEGIWSVDREFVTTFVNPRMADMLGYRVVEMLGRRSTEFMHEEEREPHLQRIEARRRGVSETYERRYRHRDGSVRWLLTAATPLMDPDGAFAGSFAMLADITERRRAEEELRNSERRFRAVLENMSLIGLMLDREGRVLLANDFLLRLTGWEREEVLGRDWFDTFVPADIRGEVRSIFDRTIGTGLFPVHFENEIVTRRGERRMVAWNNSLFSDEQGNIASVTSIGQDITERRTAEFNLRLSEARYRTLVENIPLKVFLKDRESRYVSVNRAYAEELGLAAEAVVGKTDFDLYPPELAEAYLGSDRRVLAGGEVLEYDEEHFDDGRRHVIHMVKVPVTDSVGKITGVLGAFSDITERLLLEEQLRHSQKMEAVGRLAGGVAHDFNNLLTVIGGYAQIALLNLSAADPLHDNLQEITVAAERASNLTRQLLAFSRRQVLETRALDLNEVVRGMQKMLGRLLGEDIDLAMRLAEHLGRVKADPGQIEQVISNLAVNARDAMPQGGRLEILTGEAELEGPSVLEGSGLKAGRYVTLAVSDEGHGMDAQTQARIFEPFFTTKGLGKGTGLGLSTVFGIVRQSGGDIRVESAPGRGTVFRVFFPQVDEPVSAVVENRGGEIPRGTETVLVIEDDKALRKLAAEMLGTQGYTVLTTKNGEEALALFTERKERVDLVLTDVVMPGGRGPDVLKRLEQVRDGFKSLYMSGYADDSVVQLELLRREANFIQKPFTLEALARKVREALDRS
jgi:PAS domain S-box-containing protein